MPASSPEKRTLPPTDALAFFREPTIEDIADCIASVSSKDFGMTVFLSREEAEKTMKGETEK